jgi:LysM repeat protein
MAAVVVLPHRTSPPARRTVVVPSRPPLQVSPGGRRAARDHAHSLRAPGRLHPAVYRRRRLGLALAVITILAVSYLALTGLRVITGDAGAVPVSSRPAASAPAAGETYVVQPGDTLWSIARSLQPSGDVRHLVDTLSDRVGGRALVAGQSLRVDGLAS